MPMRAEFLRRLRARDILVGTFIKLRDPGIVEILGLAGFDFAILDAEHAAFDRSDIAVMAMAARAARLPLLVRIPAASGSWIATALDAGCAGIMAPQVPTADQARGLSRALRYGAGGRGFSPSTPAAEYGGRGIAGHLAKAAEECALICQIEDEDGVTNARTIADVDGVDGLLLGPVDLAVSMGEVDPGAPRVADLCRQTITAGAAANMSAGLFLGDLSRRAEWQQAGATLFVLGSDQAFLAGAAGSALATFRQAD